MCGSVSALACDENMGQTEMLKRSESSSDRGGKGKEKITIHIR